jgi:site-specific recombinase XerD
MQKKIDTPPTKKNLSLHHFTPLPFITKMKSLPIQTEHYRYLLQSYKEYLEVTGYAEKTCEGWTVHIREFFYYLEQRHIEHISLVASKHVQGFIGYIKSRTNHTRAGALSANMVNRIISAVNCFAKYLNNSSEDYELALSARIENETPQRAILSVAEVKRLYEASFLPYEWNSVAMGQRDRAILALYYGCGLRRGEGVKLNVADLDLRKRLLFVRKAKGNKQRYVPIAAKHVQDMEDYLKEGREWFLQYHDSNLEFYSRKGEPLPRKIPLQAEQEEGTSFLLTHHGTRFLNPEYRIKYLQSRAGIEQPVTLHGLRHSIATHLLQSGMDIEQIARFLGHASLVSTQIYTHIVNETSTTGKEE